MFTNKVNIDKKGMLINIAIVIGFTIFTWMWSEKNNGVIESVLSGIKIEDNMIKTLNLGKWLFLFAVYFLMLNRIMVENKKMILFSLYRYKDFKEWWRHHFMLLQKKMLFYYLLCCIIWYLIEIVTNNHSENIIPIITIFYIHIAMFFSVLIAANQIFDKSITPCVLILIEGLSYIASVQYPTIVMTCGMHCTMATIENIWFKIILLVMQAIICYFSYFLVVFLWKKDKLELLR